MTDLLGILHEPWFGPALAVIVGLPIALLVLGEIHTGMVRRGTPGTGIVLLARNVLAPLAAVMILFSIIPQGAPSEFSWAKVAATAFGFVVILILLNGLNLAVFVTAKQGTWRNRIPSIFVDLARIILIVVSLAILFGWIWGADIGGFFTALGVGSIVIGLALQNAVGGVLSGLFLLFEQPFEMGDYIFTTLGKGRVVAVNWRATHLDTANGILIIPNSELAGMSFKNLTRATTAWETADLYRFSTDDPPQHVMDVMYEVAMGLPELAGPEEPYVRAQNKGYYEINLPLTAPGKSDAMLSLFRTRLWYASRRAGLHLDRDLTDNYATPERTLEQLTRIAPRFGISPEEAVRLVDIAKLERYGEGELVQKPGTVPNGIRVIIDGVVDLAVPAAAGAVVPVTQLKRDDLLGLTSLTRQAVAASATAVVDLAVLFIPVAVVDDLVKSRPGLARDIGSAIDHRQELGEKALTAIGEGRDAETLVIA